MNKELKELFERQAAWQKGRAKLSWPEKIRMVEALRESIIRIRKKKAAVKKDETDSKA
ncbi:MAG: hypothetical protein HY046_07520 [Acidobacteria bacterium]|nr:hypothetical protein [Acidobacteriota bacterium]